VKFSEVDKKDCLALAEFLKTLRAARLPDADIATMVQFTDGLRWLQELAQNLAKSYAEEQNPQPAKSEGFSIKEYHPGEVSVAKPKGPAIPIKRGKK